MAMCDLCGGKCGANSLVQLRDSYQVDGVVDICPSCEKWADARKNDLVVAIGPQMRQLIRDRLGKPQPRSVLRRWFDALTATPTTKEPTP